MAMNRAARDAVIALCLALGSAGCGDDGDGVSSEERARRAYFGLDRAIGLAMDLGFDGFNAATSANIPAQQGDGEVRGTLTVSGKVDQGASNNKEMRLDLALVDYTDTAPQDDLVGEISYDTGTPTPVLTLSLKKIPSGTLDGTLVGTFVMSEGLAGDVDLNLTMAGMLEPDPSDATKTRRKPGSTTITGTATSDFGVFSVNLTR